MGKSQTTHPQPKKPQMSKNGEKKMIISGGDKSRPPGNASPLRTAVAHHPVAAFLIMAYAIGWGLQLGAFQLGVSTKPSI